MLGSVKGAIPASLAAALACSDATRSRTHNAARPAANPPALLRSTCCLVRFGPLSRPSLSFYSFDLLLVALSPIPPSRAYQVSSLVA